MLISSFKLQILTKLYGQTDNWRQIDNRGQLFIHQTMPSPEQPLKTPYWCAQKESYWDLTTRTFLYKSIEVHISASTYE